MAKNTIADLDTTAGNNTDVLGQSTAGTANANTLDTIVQNMLGLLARFYNDLGGVVTVGGTANAITLTSTSTYQALETGLFVGFKNTSGPNTGATTLNLDTLGAKSVRKGDDEALAGGEMVDNGFYILRYDTALDSGSGGWALVNPVEAALDLSTYAKLDTEDQTLTGGARVTPKSLGIATSGTLTLDPGDRPIQYYINQGAHTLAPGSNTGSIILEISNQSGSGAITTSGFTKVVGAFTATAGDKFICTVVRSQNYSLLNIQALQ